MQRVWFAVAMLLAMSGYCWFEARFIGFPDGFRSEWDIYRRILLYSLCALGMATAALLFFNYDVARSKGSRSPMRIVVWLYSSVWLLGCFVDSRLASLAGRGG